MKIVQSFWSLPAFSKSTTHNDSRSFGGWSSKRHYYMSWALSCLQLRKYYADVELYTDSRGKELLIDCLQLPYTKVHTDLDSLSSMNPYLWTTGKLLCYSLQRGPFIHVDSDIFIWRKFDNRVEDAELLAQNPESNEPYYRGVVDEMSRHFHLPQGIQNELRKGSRIIVSNTGIVGGSNIEFIRAYTSDAFDIINKNQGRLNGINKGAFSVTVEQFLFYFFAKEKKIAIEYLFREEIDYLKNKVLVNFHLVPEKCVFIHPLSAFKRSFNISNGIELSLRDLYPSHYFRIMKFCDLNKI